MKTKYLSIKLFFQRLFPAILLAFVSLGHSSVASAGINTWTSIGPEGGFVSSLAINPVDPAILYVGTISSSGLGGNGIFKSTDGGGSWAAVNTGLTYPIIQAVAVDPLNPNVVYAGTAGGGAPIFKSVNGGANWSPASTGLPSGPISTVVINPVSTSIVYVGRDGVYKSANGGGSWSPAKTGLPVTSPLALTIDPLNPDTLYAGYAGFQTGLFKTVNSGGSWITATAGLTDTNVYALKVNRNVSMGFGHRSGKFSVARQCRTSLSQPVRAG